MPSRSITAGERVAHGGERHHLVALQHVEAEADGGARGLCRIALSPGIAGQPPAELDPRGELGLEADAPETGEADERAGLPHLQRPPARAVALDRRRDDAGERVALPAISGAGKWRISSGSALSAANGARSSLRQWRSSRRSVGSSATPATVAVGGAQKLIRIGHSLGWPVGLADPARRRHQPQEFAAVRGDPQRSRRPTRPARTVRRAQSPAITAA